MKKTILPRLIIAVALVGAGACGFSKASVAAQDKTISVYAAQPTDAQAVTVAGKGDGRADDTQAIQDAIDKAGTQGPAGGIVFLPSGRYRLSKTVFLWPGVRVFGVGPTRPVLVLADHTPGFQKGIAAMVVFAGGDITTPAKPPAFPVANSVPYNPKIADANPDTFYSVLSNIDVQIGAGNEGAVGVRFHPAQHSILSHMAFYVGSGLAGVYQVGNEAEDLHFFGGRYGILAEKTSPAWQFALIDSTFQGQTGAAIREHEAGLTLINTRFQDAPVAIEIDRGYGDWLWGKGVRFEDISNAAIVISNEASAYTQIGFEGAVARNVPTFARFRDSGRTVAGAGPTYAVKSFTHGLTLPGLGQMGQIETHIDAAALAELPPLPPAAIRAMPPVKDWVNVKSLGAKGDGVTDDTAALQKAIATNRVLYFPSGRYEVSDTLTLKPDTILLGLHPSRTQIILPDNTPAFAGVGTPKALIETPRGGSNIVAGLGLFTGGVNPRASAIIWRAGETSLLADVKLEGGHGTFLADASRFNPYNATHSADADPSKRWDGQYPSVWVTDNGGGTFVGIWSPDTYAQAGLLVSNTSTPGHVYDFSNEHHVRTEMVIDGVSNWEFLDFQSEEEVGESAAALSLEIRNSHNILIADYHGYRVTRSARPGPPSAVKLYNSSNIRFRNLHVNAESGIATCDENGCGTLLRASHYPFENAIVDVTSGLQVREREFAVLDVPGSPKPVPPSIFENMHVEKLGDGFSGLLSPAVDAKGRVYFIDRLMQRIYRWSEERKLEVVRDNPMDADQLMFDRSGDLMVLSSAGAEGTVYSFRPDSPASELTIIPPTPVVDHPTALIVLPVNWWVNGEFRDQIDPKTYEFATLREMFFRSAGQAKEKEYVSPDRSLALPAYRVFQQGPSDYTGWRWSQTLVANGLISARRGDQVYVTNESEDVTYRAWIGEAGTLVGLQPFANRGGEAVAVDPEGRVYVANGEVFVYGADGKALGRIDLPERPIALAFGGADRRTLFVLSQHSLFRVMP